MATIRKRILPSGKERWQVDFTDQDGKRRAKLFLRKKEADAFLVSARARVTAGTYIHDADSATLGEAAQAWLDHCAVRRDAGRRMERATYRDYEDKVRLHLTDPAVGLAALKLSRPHPPRGECVPRPPTGVGPIRGDSPQGPGRFSPMPWTMVRCRPMPPKG